MASGFFKPGEAKIRPGIYFDFESNPPKNVEPNNRGIAVVPIVSTYGAKGTIVEFNADNAGIFQPQLGYAATDDNANMLLIREALKNATTVYAYVINTGTAATATVGDVIITAKRPGSHGNDIKVIIQANAVRGGFDFNIYFGVRKVEVFEGVTTVAALVGLASNYVTFTAAEVEQGATPAITATAGTNLAGGTSADVTAEDLTACLNALENISFNAVAFPFALSTTGATTAVKSKITYLRETIGHTGQFVCANFEANHEGIINVVNGVVLEDGTTISAEQATAYVAGATAGAPYNYSNTNKVYKGAVKVNGVFTHEQIEAAINAGKFLFSLNNSGEVVCEYDINSLTDFSEKELGYRKNRFIRVIDQLIETLQRNFPAAKYDNVASDWDIIECLGNAILKNFENDKAIKDVNYTNDFKVDRSSSVGDSTYINVAIKPVDSAEKLYFTIKTST